MFNQINNTNSHFLQNPISKALSSYENLVTYLDIDNEVQTLLAEANQNPPSPSSLILNSFLTTSLRIEAIYLNSLNKMFNHSKPYLRQYFPSYEKQIDETLRYNVLRNQALYLKNIFKEKLLTHSLHIPYSESPDFYLPPNTKLRIHNFKNDQKEYSNTICGFSNHNGMCGGIKDWFLCLYFKTLPFYTDKTPEFHLMSVARIFNKGAPKQAEILQIFGGTNLGVHNSILGFTSEDRKPSNSKQLLYVDSSEEKEKLTRYTEDLDMGVYSIELSSGENTNDHGLCYFKFADNLGLFFDPNIGLIKLPENNSAEFLTRVLVFSAEIINHDLNYTSFEFFRVLPLDENTPIERSITLNLEE